MKTQLKKMMAACFITCCLFTTSAQTKKESLALLNIDSKSMGMDPQNMGTMVRIEIEKLNIYDVKDKYDIQYFMDQNKISMSNCYGKTCLTEVGLLMKSDKMFTGSTEHLGKTIIITYRIMDVKTSSFEKTYVHEFLYLPEEIQNMVKLSVAEMFDLPFDKNLMAKLSKLLNLIIPITILKCNVCASTGHAWELLFIVDNWRNASWNQKRTGI